MLIQCVDRIHISDIFIIMASHSKSETTKIKGTIRPDFYWTFDIQTYPERCRLHSTMLAHVCTCEVKVARQNEFWLVSFEEITLPDRAEDERNVLRWYQYPMYGSGSTNLLFYTTRTAARHASTFDVFAVTNHRFGWWNLFLTPRVGRMSGKFIVHHDYYDLSVQNQADNYQCDLTCLSSWDFLSGLVILCHFTFIVFSLWVSGPYSTGCIFIHREALKMDPLSYNVVLILHIFHRWHLICCHIYLVLVTHDSLMPLWSNKGPTIRIGRSECPIRVLQYAYYSETGNPLSAEGGF